MTPDFLEKKWDELTNRQDASVERAYFPYWLHEMTARAAKSPRVNYE